MIDPRDAGILEAMIRRESRSLLQYVGEAFPWVRSGTEEELTRLRQILREDSAAIAALARFLTRRRHTAPFLGPYPMAFTTLNFVSLDYLVPRLIDEQGQHIAALERDRAALTDADAKAEVNRLLEVKRQHLQDLEALVPAVAGAA
jgi:hypothetical protein